MTLTEKQEKQFKNMPIVKSVVFKSEDGKFVVHRTTLTDIKPVKYYDEVLKAEETVV